MTGRGGGGGGVRFLVSKKTDYGTNGLILEPRYAPISRASLREEKYGRRNRGRPMVPVNH